MKKADEPLNKDIKTPDGTEIFKVVKAFTLPSNVWFPRTVTQKHRITEPLLAHYAQIYHTLGGIELGTLRGGVGYYKPTHTLNKQHFAARLTRPAAERLIQRVITNAEYFNENNHYDIQIDEVGVFGSYLSEKLTLGDVDIVYRASFKKNKKPLPESSYFYTKTNEPTCLVRQALEYRIKTWEVSAHYIVEVETIGAAYKILWTKEKGHVQKKITAPIAKAEEPDNREKDRINKECKQVRDTLKNSHFPAQIQPRLPKGTSPMPKKQWEDCIAEDRDKNLIPTLAHIRCLPEGPLKKEWEIILEKEKDSEAYTSAQKLVDRFLSRSLIVHTNP